MDSSTQRPHVDLSWIENSRKRKARTPKSAPRAVKGRPSLIESFPDVVEKATSFIESNGFRAHQRRREEIGTCGTTIPELRQHLLDSVPGLLESHPKLGERTVARLMQPPNKANRASKYYKGVIDAKVPSKENSIRKQNTNSHFYSSRVKYSLEMAAKIGERAMVFSADNKNKVRVGDSTLAVDRRIQIERYFPNTDLPNYHDHDFPVPGYLLTPSGYLRMEPTQALTIDELGRERFRMPVKSRSTIVLRSPHSSMNITSHLNDFVNHVGIKEAVQDGKRAMVLIVDGGPDFNVNHGINELYFGRFFRDTGLDGLIITSYCPGDSALNPVEHLWAPCTKALTGVYLPATLEGEDRPPAKQAGLSTEARTEKEHAVFNEAMRRVKDSYWRSLNFGGGVTTTMEASGTNPEPYGPAYEEDKRVLGMSSRQFRQHEMSNEVRFLHRHMDKRIGTTIFAKCVDPSCDYCVANPPLLTAEDMDILRHFPSPSPSHDHPGHFVTFKETLEQPREEPCQHLPLFHQKGLGRCSSAGCRYVFTSKKDKQEHRLRVHTS